MSEVLLTIGGKPVHGRRAPCGLHLLPDEREAPGKLHPQGHNGLPLEPRLHPAAQRRSPRGDTRAVTE
jgi:hypothetical protein